MKYLHSLKGYWGILPEFHWISTDGPVNLKNGIGD